MKFRDLICDPDGSLSHTKVWSNIGFAAMTAAFVKTAALGDLTPELLLAYGAVLTAHHQISNYLGKKFAASLDTPK